MQLSEAINIGSTCVLPRKGGAAGSLTSPPSGCAQDMAAFAVGSYATRYAVEIWPWLGNEHIDLPCGCSRLGYGYSFAGTVAHIFDQHVLGDKQWGLEKLVDYVRSIEPSAALEEIAAKLPDLPLSEQHRLEEIDAEREALVSGRDPIHDSNGRW